MHDTMQDDDERRALEEDITGKVSFTYPILTCSLTIHRSYGRAGVE